MQYTFNSQNPEQIKLSSEFLHIEVMGGLNMERLDHLQVTLRVSDPKGKKKPLRDRLDLYNYNRLNNFIRNVAERMDYGIPKVERVLEDLVSELERYRLHQFTEVVIGEEDMHPMSEKEEQTIKTFLKQKQLTEKINEVIGNTGLVGEEKNRLLMYIIFLYSKMPNPLHVISFGSSGAGKTHLQSKVLSYIPNYRKMEVTSMSGNSLFYEGKLSHKVIAIEDYEGVNESLYVIRELQSKQVVRKRIPKMDKRGITRTIELMVEGPVCVAGCTTKEEIYEDNANRSFLIYIDESEEQDERVLSYQRLLAGGQIDIEGQKQEIRKLSNIYRSLSPISIRNPYASELSIPKEVLKRRRTNAHYLQFIEAVTYVHQYQRKQEVEKSTGEVYINTTIEDIKIANELLIEVLIRKSDLLTGGCRQYFEELKTYLKSREQESFVQLEIRKAFHIAGTTQKRYISQLIESGLLRTLPSKQGRAKKYEVVTYGEYSALIVRVEKHLGAIINKLEQSKKTKR